MEPAVIETPRLRLRAWTPADRPAFQRLGSAKEVVERLNHGFPLTDEQIDAFLARQRENFDRRGWCRFAIEVCEPAPGDPASPIGFCGFGCNFAPLVELGWTLLPEVWGRGYATEAGRAALGYGFEVVGFEHVISAVAASNDRSRRVAEKVGLTVEGTFEYAGEPHYRYGIDNPGPIPAADRRYRRDCHGSGPSLPPRR